MNVCKFCGAKRAETPFHSHMAAYYCGSWHDGSRHWSQGIACRNRCEQIRVQHEQTIETLRQRVATAIAAIEAITTYRLEKDDHGAWLKGASDGIWMDRLEVENVKKILQGNSPEIPEGSP